MNHLPLVAGRVPLCIQSKKSERREMRDGRGFPMNYERSEDHPEKVEQDTSCTPAPAAAAGRPIFRSFLDALYPASCCFFLSVHMRHKKKREGDDVAGKKASCKAEVVRSVDFSPHSSLCPSPSSSCLFCFPLSFPFLSFPSPFSGDTS